MHCTKAFVFHWAVNLAHVEYKPVIFRHLVDTWFIHQGHGPDVNKSRIHKVPINNGPIFHVGEVSEL